MLSQNSERSYYFDLVTISNVKDYNNGLNGKIIRFSNQNDSTYSLSIRKENSINKAIITDRKKRDIIKFDMDFEYETVEDLNNLSNSKLYTVVDFSKNKMYKNYIEDFEYEIDSVNNKTIVHITRFKNKKRKKIFYENYYFLGVNDNYDPTSPYAVKNYVLNKYKLKVAENKHLEKILHLKEGKISRETNNISTQLIDFNFQFKIDEVYPKRINNSTLYNYIQR